MIFLKTLQQRILSHPHAFTNDTILRTVQRVFKRAWRPVHTINLDELKQDTLRDKKRGGKHDNR
jgi:hypothetical protein